MKTIRLMTLAPGHFHAALVQKRMTPGVHYRGHVYAPLDADTLAHLDRIAAFNARPDDPTFWEVDLRAGPDWFARFLREQPGNTVVLSGRNRPKIDLMAAAVASSLHVLADKPWVIEFGDLQKLEEMLHEADLREVLTWDVLTERYEITNQVQRELVRDPDIFGHWQAGAVDRPALVLESIHHLKKEVAGRPLVRPWWWFDPAMSGDAMADVGTHLADLALSLVSHEYPFDYRTDVQVIDADRWSLVLSEGQFRALTGLPEYPPELAGRVVNDQLYYAGNNTADMVLRGVHVRLSALWEFEPVPGGGDRHTSVAQGTKANVAIRQLPAGQPEVYVAAADPGDQPALFQRLQAKCVLLDWRFPGLEVEDLGTEARVTIPVELRTDHESHFAAVLDEYVRYFNTPRAVPPWERPNTLARYYITTKAVELARAKRPGV